MLRVTVGVGNSIICVGMDEGICMMTNIAVATVIRDSLVEKANLKFMKLTNKIKNYNDVLYLYIQNKTCILMNKHCSVKKFYKIITMYM